MFRSVPEADLLPSLPQLLGPLLAMVADPNRELRQAVLKTLQARFGDSLPESLSELDAFLLWRTSTGN